MKILALTLLALLFPSSAFSGSSQPLTVLRISKDKRAIEVQRLGDPKATRVDVLAKCGAPAVGDPQIRWFEQSRDIVLVGYGKHCSAQVSLRSLTAVCSACD